MCHEDSRVLMSEEEEIAAEESLVAYCKPVELYNILQRRAIRNVCLSLSLVYFFTYAFRPKFLTISLLSSLPCSPCFSRDVYIIRLKLNIKGGIFFFLSSFCLVIRPVVLSILLSCRIQMTVFLSGTIDAGVQTQKLFPLYILLARLVSPKPVAEVCF